jgi:hypothetical protein
MQVSPSRKPGSSILFFLISLTVVIAVSENARSQHPSSEQGRNASGGSFNSPYTSLDWQPTSGSYSAGNGFEKGRLVCPGNGSFKWKYMGPPKSCQSAAGNSDFLQLLDQNFQKCVARGARAAGISSNWGRFSGEVVHKGIEGDARHKANSGSGSSSLHNVGRAIDIGSINVNGTVMDFAKASKQAKGGGGKEYEFFMAFRTCWSEVSKNSQAACANKGSRGKGQHFGSVGWEDGDHQNHIHISMPVCDQSGFKGAAFDYRQKSVEIFLALFRPELAVAATPGQADSINLKLSNGAIVEGKARFAGEPVSQPVKIELKIQCKGAQQKDLETGLSVCDYVSIAENKALKKIQITYREARFNEKDGRYECGEKDTTNYDIPCPH